MRINHIIFYVLSIFILFPDLTESAKQIADNKPTSIISTRPDVQITIETSRAVIALEDVPGIVAKIKNNSVIDIFFKPRNITMIPPPELNLTGDIWWGTVNNAHGIAAVNEIKFGDKTDQELSEERWRTFYIESDLVVRLRSGDTVPIFWFGLFRKDFRENFFRNFLRASVFAPGDYSIHVAALYWLDENDASIQNLNYYNGNAETKIRVTSPQYVIMIGAIIGGLSAYIILLLPKLLSAKICKLRYFLDPLSAALFGVIVSVLLSRISESQFFIRVTVNDLWGAMAIGFIANAAGISILDRFFPSNFKGKKGDV